MASAPGPSPWYLRAPGIEVTTSSGLLAWREAGRTPDLTGKTVLSSPAGDPLLVLGFYCYVRGLGEGRLLIWWHEGNAALGELGKAATIRLTLVDADQLKPIPNLRAACNEMDQHRWPGLIPAGIVSSTEVATGLAEGVYHHEFPTEMKEIGELLLLDPHVGLRLLVLSPQVARLEVFPQNWFNEGDYDFGYQWVTRVTRDPRTGNVLAEGMRLGLFELDASNRQVSKWYIQDPFYGPRG